MQRKIAQLIKQHGTPSFILDHNKLRKNYRTFKKNLPRVQCDYAVKANTHPEIIKTLFLEGRVLTLPPTMNSCRFRNISIISKKRISTSSSGIRSFFQIPSKIKKRWQEIKRYRPLVTFDNNDEIKKIKANCNTAGLILRLKVPDTGSQVEMSSKFGAEPGDAAELIDQALRCGSGG